MPSLYINIIGVIGMFIVLINLFLLEEGKEAPRGIQYLLLGLLGSILLMIYSVLTNSLIFTVINFVFALLNAYWLIIILNGGEIRKRKRKS